MDSLLGTRSKWNDFDDKKSLVAAESPMHSLLSENKPGMLRCIDIPSYISLNQTLMRSSLSQSETLIFTETFAEFITKWIYGKRTRGYSRFG